MVAIAKDPKTGTGKKPKGSGRRLYTDENPKDTVSIKFATVADAQATARKVKRINKPFAEKIQILTVLEQRAKVAGKTSKPKSQRKRKKTSEPNTKPKKEEDLEKMPLKKSQKVLRTGQSKNGVQRVVSLVRRQENAICLKKL